MKLNESNTDRIIRAVAGLVLLYLGLGGVLAGGLAVVADVLAVVLLLTAAVGFCPLYAMFKFGTLKK
jgi:phage-related minor tail protein